MELIKRSFAIGWAPDADSVNGPPDALLRADNLILDEVDALVLRMGSSKINANALADLDVHSLFTVVRSGTRYRYWGANNKVYRNGVDLGVTFAGSGDISFGSYMGYTFMARSTTKRKDDGSTVRNWGIAMTGGAPIHQAALAGNFNQLATWDSTEATHTILEDDGTGVTYGQDRNGASNAAIRLFASPVTIRGIVVRSFATDQDFSQYTGPVQGSDDDIVSSWVYLADPSKVQGIVLHIDVNGGTFYSDFYYFAWAVSPPPPSPSNLTNPNDPGSPTEPEPPPLI